MSVLFQTVINTGKLYSLRKSLNTSFLSCKCLLVRKVSDSAKKFVTFEEEVTRRRAEARRSVVVQVNSESSFSELYGYCSKYASINGVHHYKNSSGEHFMLIEFASEQNLKAALQRCGTHQKDFDVMALHSPFLWFRASVGKKEKFTLPNTVSLNSVHSVMNEDKMLEDMLNCSSISEQIQLLYDRTVLDDLGVRLRYMVARQLECVFASLYANIVVRPFGSSVNGFGKMGSDLDLVLTNMLPEEMTDPKKRLVYQEKKSEGGRSPWQRHLELVGELLELRVAGTARVHRILNARVPIVKYAHEFTDLDCDLCYNNMSGVYMSELLWCLGSLDPRVRVLTLTVRRWANSVGLTSAHPGRWITNFPLTLLVLFFLQNTQGPILPPVKTLVREADKQDVRISEENLNCTFLRDMNKLPPDCYGQNSINLETLLLQFFAYYAQFDFHEKAISINEGEPVRKPNSLPLYIVNPLEQALNVSRNVSYEECERLKLEVRNAAWQLETDMDSPKSDDWGILSLIEKKTTRGLKRLLRVGNSHRLVSVKDLFDDSEQTSPDGFKTKMQRLTQKSDGEIDNTVKEMSETMKEGVKETKHQTMKFKNTQVANEVYRIRRNKLV